MNARRTTVVVRSAYGTVAVEWFIIVAIITILITRAYRPRRVTRRWAGPICISRTHSGVVP